MKEDDGGQTDAESALACDPGLTEVQASSIPSSQFYTACMYYSLLIHIQIMQLFKHHAQSASICIICFPLKIIATPSHTRRHLKVHRLSLWDG